MDLNHPIFKFTEDLGFNASSEQLLEESILNFDLLCSRNDDELFLVTQRSIRTCNVHSSQYKLLQLSEPIGFEPVKALLNNSGTLMALNGAKNLMLVSLPTSEAVASTSDGILYAKSQVVGKFESTDICKVLFNEVSKAESNVVVLASDGCVRSFDINLSSEIPFHIFRLNEKLECNGLGYQDTLNATSISFGSSVNAVGSLSLYVNTEIGDVYTIFPFFPTILSVSLSFLKQLTDQTIELAKSSPDSIEALVQLKLVSQMLKNKEKFPVEFKISKRTGLVEKHYVIPVNIDLINSMELQGPLIISKFPDELYTEDGIDICHVNSQDQVILVSSWSNGSILVLRQQKDLCMRWRSKNVRNDIGSHNCSVLTVIAHFKTQSKCLMFPSFNSVLIKNRDYHLLTADNREPRLSKLRNRDGSSFSDTVLGVAQLTGFAEGKKAIILTKQTVECVTIPTSVVVAPSSSILCQQVSKPIERLIATVRKNSLMNIPFQEVFRFLESIKQKNAEHLRTISVGSFVSDEATLMEVQKLGDKMLHRIFALNKLSLMLLHRLALQQKEFKDQIIDFMKTKKKLDSHAAAVKYMFTQYSNRLERMKSRRSSIQSSLTALLCSLESSTRKSLPISAAEKEYFRELNLIKAKVVNREQGIQSQFEFLVNQVEYLQMKLQTYNKNKTNASLLIPTVKEVLTSNRPTEFNSWKNMKEQLIRNEQKSRQARQLLSKQLRLVNDKLAVLDLHESA
ncbi:hypothetical protein LJB42_001578 [Komagataella kurtzmanii]|nr:hypothetical protein LJB42_001578 [Komagataella kurtzmanii]